MCTETGIKHVYRGVQGACPRRAMTHAGGMAERSERRAVGMGLKLVGSLPLALPHYDTCDALVITDLPYMVVSHDLGQWHITLSRTHCCAFSSP